MHGGMAWYGIAFGYEGHKKDTNLIPARAGDILARDVCYFVSASLITVAGRFSSVVLLYTHSSHMALLPC